MHSVGLFQILKLELDPLYYHTNLDNLTHSSDPLVVLFINRDFFVPFLLDTLKLDFQFLWNLQNFGQIEMAN